MLGYLKSLFGSSTPSVSTPTKPTKEEIVFERVDDGQYFVKYIDEKASVGEFILFTLEITQGLQKGIRIPLEFRNAAAKRVTKEAKGDYAGRLAFEGVALAEKLDQHISGAQYHDFIVRVKDGKIVSIYAHDETKMKTFTNKLEADPNFKG